MNGIGMLKTSPLKTCVPLVYSLFGPCPCLPHTDAETSRLLRVIGFHALLTLKYVFPERTYVREALLIRRCLGVNAERHFVSRKQAQDGTPDVRSRRHIYERPERACHPPHNLWRSAEHGQR
jgi:hypothetical protein